MTTDPAPPPAIERLQHELRRAINHLKEAQVAYKESFPESMRRPDDPPSLLIEDAITYAERAAVNADVRAKHSHRRGQ